MRLGLNCGTCCRGGGTCTRAATAAKDAKDWSLSSFGSHLNPISTRGGRLCPPYTGVLGWLKFAVAALKVRQLPNHSSQFSTHHFPGQQLFNSFLSTTQRNFGAYLLSYSYLISFFCAIFKILNEIAVRELFELWLKSSQFSVLRI